jgi:exopolyphosphatase/guanosine-5'-triphosphate,3'-diphosphate pyrophosphatase
LRVAAIDIGTNTVLLLIAETTPQGELRAVVDRARITRLGEGVDRTRRLSPAAIDRTLACLSEYAGEIARHGVSAVGVAGTSAMRDAATGGEHSHGPRPEGGRDGSFVARAAEILGVEPRVVSGAEEAELAFSGGLLGLGLSGPVTAFDVGGGSSELIVGVDGRVVRRQSLDMGSVRLFERHVRSDPPSAHEMSIVSAFALDQLLAVPPPPAGQPLVGMAGTVTTLAAIARQVDPYDPARIHGMRLSAGEIAETARRLTELPLARRVALPGLDPKRADVIPVGAALVNAIVAWARAPEIIVSDRGVRWGVALRLCQNRWS